MTSCDAAVDLCTVLVRIYYCNYALKYKNVFFWSLAFLIILMIFNLMSTYVCLAYILFVNKKCWDFTCQLRNVLFTLCSIPNSSWTYLHVSETWIRWINLEKYEWMRELSWTRKSKRQKSSQISGEMRMRMRNIFAAPSTRFLFEVRNECFMRLLILWCKFFGG